MSINITLNEMKVLHSYFSNGNKSPKIGADPRVIRNALEHVDDLMELKNNYLPFQCLSNIYEPPNFVKYLNSLPAPHMLFSDWRFNKKTRIDLIKLISNNEWNASPHIAFICSPHLGVLFNMIFPQIKISIYDINATIIEIAREFSNENVLLETIDVKSISKDCHFTSIIYDPPLYLSYYQTILDLAHSTLCNNGNLYYVYPNTNLREDFRERLILQRLISEYNFIIENVYNSILYYDVPQFEKNTYKQIGINCNIDWRNHQLYQLKKCNVEISRQDENDSIIFDIQDWEIYRFNEKQVALNIRRMESENDHEKLDPQLISVYNDFGNVLKSVSSRHSNRQFIDLWTSDNIAYKVNHFQVVKDILDEYRQHGTKITNEYIYNMLNEKFEFKSSEKIYILIDQIHKMIGG